MPCRLDAEIQSDGPYTNGLVTTYAVFGHASRDCNPVHLVVSESETGRVVFDDDVTPDFRPIAVGTDWLDPVNDGLWRVILSTPTGLPCGLPLWVHATCPAGDGTCEVNDWRNIMCKQSGPGGGTTGQPGGGTPGGGVGTPSWPWGDPPHIACVLWGQSFLQLLFWALFFIALGVSARHNWLIVAGVANLGLAGAMKWFWSRWCVPNDCILWGGILYVYKWAIVCAFMFAILYMNFAGWLVMIVYGIIGGWIELYLRQRRCPVPSARTPFTQLPLW